jgi:hypothetical protein
MIAGSTLRSGPGDGIPASLRQAFNGVKRELMTGDKEQGDERTDIELQRFEGV